MYNDKQAKNKETNETSILTTYLNDKNVTKL